ncbi:MATH domain and coiled-coil domain-containing protein At3g58410-like [Rhodamnia argentea]|uniref:MATH domain and coiled-coil domain-containing protein At3g58410-like n=1 Tax=Rhodamnia argentea TaxID=178133 RepID=A0ABM3HM03_9MYRT|nr:MATH domain and coiled-coil domain-containing protein At3g58410-like [Rhodamnia argentea]
MSALTDVNRGVFTWKISNFTGMIARWLYSETFIVSGCQWRIIVYPKGHNTDHLSLYLETGDSARLPDGWTKFSLSVIDQTIDVRSIRIETQRRFNERERGWGYRSFMSLTLLHNPRFGYIANDSLVIKAEVCVSTFAHPVNSRPARPIDSFDSYFTGLEELIKAAGTNMASVGPSSCHQDGALTTEIPSLEEIEKAKQSLKECLMDLFKLTTKERLSEALSTLRSARTGLSLKQQIAIETFQANFSDFTSDFLAFEQDNSEFELHKLQKDQRFSDLKKCHEIHILYKQLMDELIKEEEEVKSRREKLLSDWEILLVESEEAKSGYQDEQKKVAEAEEKKRLAEERMSRSTGAWANLKAQFC